MKSIKIFAAVLALTSASFAATAADSVTTATGDLQSMGYISASGATNLDSLEAKLAAKAEQAGASSYRIISTTGQNKLHGTAEIYK